MHHPYVTSEVKPYNVLLRESLGPIRAITLRKLVLLEQFSLSVSD
jgi:hypothetical protein